MDENQTPRDGGSGSQAAEKPERQAQPADDEQPPRLPFPVVGIGASAGGLEAVGEFLDAMPPDGGMAFVLVQHLPPDRPSMMTEILARRTAMPVAEVEDGMAVEADHVYVIRPGHLLTIREGRLHLGPRLGTPRAANRPIDDFFKSLAEEQRERAIAVVMSGMGSNGAAGAQAIKAVGGLCIAQDPESALFPSMPRHLIDAGYADYILHPRDLPDVLLGYARHPYTQGDRQDDAEAEIRREHQHLREILAVLRSRTGKDFSGYKKPTLLRRIQRRMGLTRLANAADYARLLRQSPGEVSALADDLLIHVTGFFRDPEAWAALHQSVIVPLVANRKSGDSIRAWVTACSSGEEAYSLAILLMEEAERARVSLDIKVFATDLADRTLVQARAGVYPGGIESEMSAERLNRFFTQEDELHRIRPELRDRVVFAPQNILQDPPFSRLDIAACRNLLIYLEPEVQQRVLGLLHFGLREGGVLFLGSSETVAGAEDLFEPIDKKARIFRRVGPTRHGAIEFPMPHAIMPAADLSVIPRPSGGGGAPARLRRDADRMSIAELTRLALLEAHTPPAVTVDRDGRIAFYHGDTRPFLQQLTGEPTRELMLLAREGVRGVVRTALQRAIVSGERAEAADGWIDFPPDRRARVAVTASPIVPNLSAGEGAGISHFVVSFHQGGDYGSPATLAANAGSSESVDEMRRLRAELQGTIEELQTSNEELKASHEEVMSINEEYQSANEELETSKEEMQSLNEELTTVNAQLRAKMEELQATSGDLASLLTSTDIAVLFLDTEFRIRRYTAAVRELVDLIASDVGRPLSALARRFTDPRLDDDARLVLNRLVPIEREIPGDDGRHYLRRILPYRTTDNRIDGVVVTFVDITARLRAEEDLRALIAASSEVLYRMNPDWSVMRMLSGSGLLIDSSEPRRDWMDWYIPEDERSRVATAIAAAIQGKAVFALEHRIRRADGSIGWVSSRAVPLLGIEGEVIGWFGAASDITSRKEAEAALRSGEARLRAVAANLPNGATFVVGPDLRYLLAGGQALGPAGMSPADLEGRTIAEALGPDLAAEHEAQYRRALAGESLHLEHVAHGRHYVTHLAPLRDADGRVAAALAVSYDITDRVRAEASARESGELFRLLVENVRDYAIFFMDPDGRIAGWWEGAERLLGYPADEVLGSAAARFYAFEGHGSGALERELAEATRVGRTTDEGWLVRKDGTRFWASGAVTALRDSAGGLRGFVKIFQDQTEARATETAIRNARDRLRLALEAARMGIWIWDLAADSHTRDANLNRLLGLDAAETSQPFADFLDHVHPEDRTFVESSFQAAIQQHRLLNIEFRVVWPDGSVRWLRDQGDVFGAGEHSPPYLAGACVDVTDLKDAEAALRRSRDELEERVAERTGELAEANRALRRGMDDRTELLRRLVTAQEDERRRVARDLHDGLGQELTALILGLGSLAQAIPKDSAGRERLREVEATVSRIGREAHDLAVDLRPTALDDLGLEPALAAYVARWSERTRVIAEFQTHGPGGDRLPPEVETTVYRVVQEALNNAARHAGAGRVSVILERHGDELTALIEDDGRGFDPNRPNPSDRTGLGLLGMRERVSLVGGTLLIESGEGQGTTVRARIPLARPSEESNDDR